MELAEPELVGGVGAGAGGVAGGLALTSVWVGVANAMFFSLKLLIYEPYYLCLSRLECQA